MKNKITLTIFFAMISLSGLQGDDYGFKRYGEETLNSIEAYGAVVLEGTRVLGQANINGSLNADESEIYSLEVNGDAHLMDSHIYGISTVNGSLSAENSKFMGHITAASQKVSLSHCSVKSLKIRSIGKYKGPQILELSNGTIVEGPIVFESENGEIWLSSKSEIVESSVAGAKIYRK